MIPIKELRIGNYVNMHGVAKIIDAIHSNNVVEFDNNDTTHHFTKIEPIPLTEEILTKCGFQKTVYGKLFFENGDFSIGIDLSNGKNIVDLWIEDEECYYRMPMILAEYLHQLQNLVYALTGEELQITL